MKRYARAMCFYEAARAIAGLVIGRKPRRVSVRHKESQIAQGWSAHMITLGGQYDVWDEVLLILAGPFAEARSRKRGVATLLRGTRREDYLEAEKWLRWLVDHGFTNDLRATGLRAEAEARLFLRTHWHTIETSAEALRARGVLEAHEVAEIFRNSATTTDRW